MISVSVIILCLVSPIYSQGFRFGRPQTRTGLVSSNLGLPPVPPLSAAHRPGVGASQPLRQNPVCTGNEQCCCVYESQCNSGGTGGIGGGTDGAGIIDIRIVNKPGSGSSGSLLNCQYPLVECCAGPGTSYPPSPQPRPPRPRPRPTSRPRPPQPRPNPSALTNPYCHNNELCCCVRRGTCKQDTSSGIGLIDIRVRPGQRQCRRYQEYCCASPHQPEPYQPEPSYPPVNPPYQPEPSYPPVNPPYQPEPGYPSSSGNLQYLNGNDCGYSQSYPNSNYHGAYGQADFGEYNFLVVILTPENYFVGAGALINPTTVVTADHKVFNQTARNLRVRAREWDAAEATEPLPYIQVEVAAIISHENSHVRYAQLTNLKNDVAILKLARPISFENEYVGSICLPSQGFDFSGYKCWVAGWGKDAFGHEGQYQRILKEVDLTIQTPYQCERALQATRLGPDFQFDGHSFICAGGQGGKDACEGDGGAPLMCQVQGRWYLAGLVAWGIGCAQSNVPGVYVNVPSFSNWIAEKSQSYRGR